MTPSFLAERKGFEPSIRYERIHAFQACDFNHSSTSLLCFALYNDSIGMRRVPSWSG